jgi:hypothetical protein
MGEDKVKPAVLVFAAACGFALCHFDIAEAAPVEAKVVSAGGVEAVLLMPAKPRASLILLTGGDGSVGIAPGGAIGRGAGNQLVRTRNAYAARGFAVLVPDRGFNLAGLVAFMAHIKRPVTMVATSRGTQRAAHGIAAGARPDRLVLTSGFLTDASGSRDNVADTLGSPAMLPPTLVIHHRNDACRFTLPAGVAPFLAWAHGKARVVWLAGGVSTGNSCEARAHHGFNGLDGQVVAAVARFAGGR